MARTEGKLKRICRDIARTVLLKPLISFNTRFGVINIFRRIRNRKIFGFRRHGARWYKISMVKLSVKLKAVANFMQSRFIGTPPDRTTQQGDLYSQYSRNCSRIQHSHLIRPQEKKRESLIGICTTLNFDSKTGWRTRRLVRYEKQFFKTKSSYVISLWGDCLIVGSIFDIVQYTKTRCEP